MKHVSALWSLAIAVLVLVIALGLVDMAGITGAAVYPSKSKEAVGMAWAIIIFIFMLAVYIYITEERKNRFF